MQTYSYERVYQNGFIQSRTIRYIGGSHNNEHTTKMSNHDSDSDYDDHDADMAIYDLLNNGEPLTVATATQVVDHIRAVSDDVEAAHSYEDSLMSTFVKQVADGVLTDIDTIRAIAGVINSVKGIGFTRYCA